MPVRKTKREVRAYLEAGRKIEVWYGHKPVFHVTMLGNRSKDELELLVCVDGDITLRDYRRWHCSTFMEDGMFKDERCAALASILDKVLLAPGLMTEVKMCGVTNWLRLAYDLGIRSQA